MKKPVIRKHEMEPEKKRHLLDEIEQLKVVLALEAGNLSEGQAAKLLAIDRVSLRLLRERFLNECPTI